jgi:hypothetical protein
MGRDSMSNEGTDDDTEPNDCADLIALLKRFGLKEAEAEDHGVPSHGTFWVKLYDDYSSKVSVGGGGDGYGGFFGIFLFQPDGRYESHGFAE